MTKSLSGKGLIGEKFTARKSYPRVERGYGRWAKRDEDFSYDIQVGEEFIVKEFDGEYYKLENISLDESGLAWFMVNQDNLDFILRRGIYK